MVAFFAVILLLTDVSVVVSPNFRCIILKTNLEKVKKTFKLSALYCKILHKELRVLNNVFVKFI